MVFIIESHGSYSRFVIAVADLQTSLDRRNHGKVYLRAFLILIARGHDIGAGGNPTEFRFVIRRFAGCHGLSIDFIIHIGDIAVAAHLCLKVNRSSRQIFRSLKGSCNLQIVIPGFKVEFVNNQFAVFCLNRLTVDINVVIGAIIRSRFVITYQHAVHIKANVSSVVVALDGVFVPLPVHDRIKIL